MIQFTLVILESITVYALGFDILPVLVLLVCRAERLQQSGPAGLLGSAGCRCCLGSGRHEEASVGLGEGHARVGREGEQISAVACLCGGDKILGFSHCDRSAR